MTYLLDTHVWVWLFEAKSELPARVRSILKDRASMPLGVSAISPWEIAKKSEQGKIELSIPARDWIMRASTGQGIELLALSPEISWDSTHLPGNFHRDPADQMIVATARTHNLILITCDQRILGYHHVKTLWK